MKKFEANSGKKPKISEMLLRVAEDFLNLGDDLEHRENLLRMACSAWNIACFEPPKRRELIAGYVEKFKETNKAPEAACKNLEENMKQLVNEKNRLYPDVMIQILNAKIELIAGREHVSVVSCPWGKG